MRDTGCTGAVVRRSLTKPEQLTGTTQTYRMIDGTVRTAPVAKVAITSPFFNGEVNAICIDKPLCDVIIGNIKGASDGCINTYTETNVVVTRQQTKMDKLPFKSLKVPEGSDLNISRDELIKSQKDDVTLVRAFEQAKDNKITKYERGGESSYKSFQVYYTESIQMKWADK